MGNMLGDPVWQKRLGTVLGNQSGFQPLYLTRDEFVTAMGAPIATPHTSEPGPGHLIKAADTGNNGSISSDQLVLTGKSVVGDPGFYIANASNTAFARVAGRAVLGAVSFDSVASQLAYFGLFTGAGLTTSGPALIVLNAGIRLGTGFADVVVSGAVAIATIYQWAVVERATGAFVFIKGGQFSQWTLIWVDALLTTDPPYPGVTNSTGTSRHNYLRLLQLGGPFSTNFGIATVNVTASSGVTQIADANGIYQLAFTLPAGGANLVAAELRYRQQDATNYWSAYIKRNAGDTQWDYYLDKVTNGTPATQAGYPVTNVGNAISIQIHADGSKHNSYTKVGNVWTKRGGEITAADFATSNTLNPIAGAGATLGAMQGWPRRSSLFNRLDWV